MRGLSGLMNKVIPTPAQLRDLGWATTGGAAGTLAVHFGTSKIADKIPFPAVLSAYKNDILTALTGAVIERFTRDWNETFAHGAVGATAGRAVASIALRLMNQQPLSDMPEDQVLAQSDQLAPRSDQLSLQKYFTSEGDFTEVEAEPRFDGVDAEVEQPLGAYLS